MHTERTGMFALVVFAAIAALFIPSPITRAGPPGSSPLPVQSIQDLRVFDPAPMVSVLDELRPGEVDVEYAARSGDVLSERESPDRLASRAAAVEGPESAARVVASAKRTLMIAGLAKLSTDLSQVPNGKYADLRASDLGA